MEPTNPADRESERGAVLVLVAVFVPVIIALFIYVIDVDNWMEHKRHLQVQADASALAAANYFQPCSDPSIYQTAGQYAGVPTVSTPNGPQTSATPLYNSQVGSTVSSSIHVLINSLTFYNQSSTSLPKTPDDTITSDPCSANMVDVKITETGLPWYFRPLSSVGFINAEARVSLFQQTYAPNAEALAVSDSGPVAATAYFVNEDNNDAILGSTPLTSLGLNAQGQTVWANSSAPAAVAINKTSGSVAHIGVVIALSGNKSDSTCGDPYVQCFDNTSTTGPSLLHIQGWSAAGTGTLTAPLARSVTLSTPSPDTCTDGYFSHAATTCTATISAWVDYGSTNTTGVSVKPVVAGTTESALTKGATSGTAVQWTGTVSLKQAGANQINLLVACTKGSGAPCGSSTSATISNVQRAYAAGTSSGPITGAWISEVGGATQDADSYEVCEAQNNNTCTHNLVVTVDVAGTLQDTQHFSDPSYAVRIGTSQGNVVGCGANPSPSASQYRANLAQGCTGPFQLNTSDPTCTQATVSPFDCVLLVSGVKNGPFQQGLTDRIVTSPPAGSHYYCANNWVNNNSGGVPIIPANDSRLISLFVMPYGSTDSSGAPLLKSGYVPIQNFATFYVTGFAGDPCASDDPAPPNAGNAWVVGHFIKYISTVGGNTNQVSCTQTTFGNCVAVLNK
jgi:Putative Flp pilus-assembly TadE/G-like